LLLLNNRKVYKLILFIKGSRGEDRTLKKTLEEILGNGFNFLRHKYTNFICGAMLGYAALFAQNAKAESAPVADNQTVNAFENKNSTVTLHATDADGDLLDYIITSLPTNSKLYQTPDGTMLGAQITAINTLITSPDGKTVIVVPNTYYYGPDAFNYKANDGPSPPKGGDSNIANVTLDIAYVNQTPSFTKGTDENVLEDSGAKSVGGWATNLNTGAPNESTQTLDFIVSNNNNPIFSVQPTVDSSGNLTYTLASNAYGLATVSVQIHDNGGTANGAVDTSAAQTFTINANGINDSPSYTKGADQTVNEDSGTQTVANWATNISAGPNETGQTLDFIVSNDNNSLFSVQPAVDGSGNLTYTPGADKYGSATVTAQIHDNGGTANGGVDTSAVQSFTITINPVNDIPYFTIGANQTVNEDSGAKTVANWATSLSPGPSNESAQTLDFIVSNDNNILFSVQPTIAADGTLTYTIAPDANGSATVSAQIHDNGGTANGGIDTSAAQTFTVTVNPVNDNPTINNSSIEVAAFENNPVTLENVLQMFNVTDLDGDAPSLKNYNVSAGTISLDGANLVITPPKNYTGDITGTVTFGDQNGGQSTGMFVIHYKAHDQSEFENNLTKNDRETRKLQPSAGNTIAKNGNSTAVVYNNADLGSGNVNFKVNLQKPKKKVKVTKSSSTGNVLAIHDSTGNFHIAYTNESLFAKPNDNLALRLGVEIRYPGLGNSAPVNLNTGIVGEYSPDPSPYGTALKITEKERNLGGYLKMLKKKEDPFQESSIKTVVKGPESPDGGSKITIMRQYSVTKDRIYEIVHDPQTNDISKPNYSVEITDVFAKTTQRVNDKLTTGWFLTSKEHVYVRTLQNGTTQIGLKYSPGFKDSTGKYVPLLRKGKFTVTIEVDPKTLNSYSRQTKPEDTPYQKDLEF
jgi:hypothetical protein